jgi:hypothetical protein
VLTQVSFIQGVSESGSHPKEEGRKSYGWRAKRGKNRSNPYGKKGLFEGGEKGPFGRSKTAHFRGGEGGEGGVAGI